MRCLSLVLVFVLPTLVHGQEKFLLKNNQRVLFLGDSNTFAGLYVAYIDAYLVTRFPDQKFELINLGLPSETVSGLSEADHPYPRPDVHERLERALAKTKPDLVVACYGMNDGIYSPFDKERLKKYETGTRKLIEVVKKSGADVMLMTPAPFDPAPVKKQVRPLGEPKYSWMKPYEKYDDVLTEYSAWLVTLRKEGIPVIDAHTAMVDFLKEVRTREPGYFLSGDGIHPNPTGHAIVASRILQAWHAPALVDAIKMEAKDALRVEGNTKIPMPADPRWHPRLATLEKLNERLNRHVAAPTNAKHPRYALFEGDKQIGSAAREELKNGLDLTRFPDLSTNRRAAELWKLVAQKERLLALAWLTDVGHKRPDTPKGIPLDEARKQGEELDRRIRELARPVTLRLRLEAADK